MNNFHFKFVSYEILSFSVFSRIAEINASSRTFDGLQSNAIELKPKTEIENTKISFILLCIFLLHTHTHTKSAVECRKSCSKKTRIVCVDGFIFVYLSCCSLSFSFYDSFAFSFVLQFFVGAFLYNNYCTVLF